MRSFWIIAGISLLAYGGMVGLHWQRGELGEEAVPYFLGWYGLAFVAWLSAIVWSERRGQVPMRAVWISAIIFRLLLLLTTPTLSTDVYRYVWDGHVANNGVSPYALPIESPQLDYLDVPVRAQANHTWMASPYMPAAQWVFASVTWGLPLAPIYFQAAMVLFDLLAALVMAQLLILAALPAQRILLYLWNPLVIVEVAHGAHIDAWMILLTMLSLWAFIKGLEIARQKDSPSHPLTLSPFHLFSPILLSFATLTKILPVLLTPVFFWRWRWWQLVLYGVLTIGLLLPAGLNAGWGLTGELNGEGLFGALRIYGDSWNYNSGLFHWIEKALETRGVVEFNAWAKRAVVLLLGGVMLAVWWAARTMHKPRNIVRLAAVPMFAYALLSATVHPWYILIVLAFLPFLPPASKESWTRWLWAVSWLYLTGAIVLSYLTYVDPQNLREHEWIRRMEWVPTILVLAIGVVANWHSVRAIRIGSK